MNISILFYFKYFLFVYEIFNFNVEQNSFLNDIVLPIGISFYTFQQISAQIDTYKKKEKPKPKFLNYTLYVIFFPQLIAGPIVRIEKMIAQLESLYQNNQLYTNLAIGFSLFAIGLSKKIILADHLGLNSDIIFLSLEAKKNITFWEAWFGILSYSFQIYFDFSAYSEMAAGIAISLGIKFPLNFYSPYRAKSIIEFWRRWHITLSEFFRDYLYIPMGGSNNKMIQFRNILFVMTLCGLWHGASWLFVIWGAMHGLAVIINHFIRSIKLTNFMQNYFINHIKVLNTFLLVTIFWVPFRATSLSDCYYMYKLLFGLNGIELPNFLKPLFQIFTEKDYVYGMFANGHIDNIGLQSVFLIICFIICMFFPNSYQLFPGAFLHKKKLPNDNKLFNFTWHETKVWAFLISLILVISFLFLGREQSFLYFQF